MDLFMNYFGGDDEFFFTTRKLKLKKTTFFANDFGCTLEQLGLWEPIEKASLSIYGDTYLFYCMNFKVIKIKQAS